MLPVFQLSLPAVPAADGQARLLISGDLPETSADQPDTSVFVDLLSEQLAGDATDGNALPPHGNQLPLPLADEEPTGGPALSDAIADAAITDYHFAGAMPPPRHGEVPIHPLRIDTAGPVEVRHNTDGLSRVSTMAEGAVTTALAAGSTPSTNVLSAAKTDDPVVHVPPSVLPDADTPTPLERRPFEYGRSIRPELSVPGNVRIEDPKVTPSSERDALRQPDAALQEIGTIRQRGEPQSFENAATISAAPGPRTREQSGMEPSVTRPIPLPEPATLPGTQVPNHEAGATLREVSQQNDLSFPIRDLTAPQQRLAHNIASAAAVKPIALPVADASWGQDLVQRVSVMTNHRLQTAEIRLSPAEMGPIRVNVSIEDGAANIAFQAHHAITREAIDLALPKLREMLLEQGLTPGQTDVRDDSPRERQARHADEAARTAADPGNSSDDELVEPPRLSAKRSTDGLLDTFV